jgi:flavin-binding protein dodecin
MNCFSIVFPLASFQYATLVDVFMHPAAGKYMKEGKVTERKGVIMPDSVYKIIEIVGSSEESWEDAAKKAVEAAGKSLKDLRVAEIADLDLKVEDGKVTAFRARVKISFKYHDGD